LLGLPTMLESDGVAVGIAEDAEIALPVPPPLT